MSEIIFSCVVDNKPKFITQAITWINTILITGTAKKEEIIIHVVNDINKNFLDYLAQLNIQFVEVDSFGLGNAVYCNKLQQLDTDKLYESKKIVLCDTDVAFLSNVRDKFLSIKKVGAKVVDRSNPPTELIEILFRKIDVPIQRYINCSFGENLTVYGNCNGGIYIFESSFLKKIKSDWKKYSTEILKEEELLGKTVKHADQLGFSAVINKLNVSIDKLEITHNFPAHLSRPEEIDRVKTKVPRVLHYHDLIEGNGLISMTSHELSNMKIKEVNTCLREILPFELIKKINGRSLYSRLFQIKTKH